MFVADGGRFAFLCQPIFVASQPTHSLALMLSQPMRAMSSATPSKPTPSAGAPSIDDTAASGVLTPPHTFARLAERARQAHQQAKAEHPHQQQATRNESAMASAPHPDQRRLSSDLVSPKFVYRDGEGDLITVASEAELSEAVRHHAETAASREAANADRRESVTTDNSDSGPASARRADVHEPGWWWLPWTGSSAATSSHCSSNVVIQSPPLELTLVEKYSPKQKLRIVAVEVRTA